MDRSLDALNEIAHFMVSGMNLEQLVAYQIPAHLVSRYEVLVEKEKNGPVTPEEKGELDSLLMINHVISLAKLMAMQKMAAA